jgi:hypothetical protein
MTKPIRRDKAGNRVGERANNGAEDKGLTEDAQIVRGPAKLLTSMRALATKRGVKISELWRRAAAAFLKWNGIKVED